MTRYILALDQGTTSSRTIIFDKQGNIISVAQKEFKQIFPQPGWVEHDAEEIWSTQYGTMAEAVAKASITMKQVAGIGITNLDHGVRCGFRRSVTRPNGQPATIGTIIIDRETYELIMDRPEGTSPSEALSPLFARPRSSFGQKVGRNEPCPCGSGTKYKRCHGH